MGLCSKCNKPIKSSEVKQCNKCPNAYHYQCLGVPQETFGKESKVYKANWKCPDCRSRGENSISPAQTTPVGTPTQAGSQVPVSQSVDSAASGNFDELKLYLQEIQREIKKQNANTCNSIQGLTESVNFMSTKLDKVQEELEFSAEVIKKQEAEIQSLRGEVTNLKSRLNQVEQNSRGCNLEVQCVPERKTENLKTVVKQLFSTVGCELSSHDLINYHRVAKKNQESDRPRSIIIKLASPLVRDSVLAAVKTYNRAHQEEKLNTSHLGLPGDKKPVYVCEHLSAENKVLHAIARKVAKEKKFQFVWVRGGKIFIRKDINSKSLTVRNQEFLESL